MTLQYKQLHENFITVNVVENIKEEELQEVPKYDLIFDLNNESYCIDHTECFNYLYLN